MLQQRDAIFEISESPLGPVTSVKNSVGLTILSPMNQKSTRSTHNRLTFPVRSDMIKWLPTFQDLAHHASNSAATSHSETKQSGASL